jgi:NADPH:quinone reductase-like Zn-dependent oxidoreductase
MTPSTHKSWTVNGQNGFDSLNFHEEAPVPELGDKDVLVKCTNYPFPQPISTDEISVVYAASLNYRDLVIPQGKYPFAQRDGVVPASDGAGIVEAVGKRVTRFKPGDKVVTLFNQEHLGGSLDPQTIKSGVGGVVDGTLREYGAFDEQGLVDMPDNLNWLEASTLSCAALTAWNGLYGLESKALKQGDFVLTQGTGGVSLFALQVRLSYQTV